VAEHPHALFTQDGSNDSLSLETRLTLVGKILLDGVASVFLPGME
jgi:hypothetical protein